MAQRVRDELRREAAFGCGPGEVLLVAAADDKLAFAPLVEVAVAGRAVVGDGFFDGGGDVLRPRGCSVGGPLCDLRLAAPGGVRRGLATDVVAPSGREPVAGYRGEHVSAKDRPVGGDAVVGAEVPVQPGLGLDPEQGLAAARVDEDVGAFVVLDLQGEVVCFAPGRERLLALV